jgi:hypothetical protein
MSYVIVLNDSGKIVRPRQYSPNAKSAAGAAVSANAMVKRGQLVVGSYSIKSLDQVRPMPIPVRNIMSGKIAMEDINLPYSCSVGSEAYFCS